MPYTFELTFTGLCVFTFGGEDPWHPKEVNALLINAAQHDMDWWDTPEKHENEESAHVAHDPHVPLLACWSQNVIPNVPDGFRLAPTPDGRLVALRGLRGEALTIHLPEHARKGLVLNWNPYRAYSTPEGQAQEDWMDWTTPLSKVYPCSPPPTQDMPYAGLNELAVASRIKLEHGELTGAEFPRIPNNETYVRWEFKELEENHAVTESTRDNHIQALSGVVSLRVPGLDSDEDIVGIESTTSGWKVLLAPSPVPGNVVRASITNLLDREPQGPKPNYLKHYLHLKKLVRWKPEHGNPKLPTPEGGHVTSGNSFCPPLSFLKPTEK